MNKDTEDKCPCGKDGRYVRLVDGKHIYSCSKYGSCPTYDELRAQLAVEREKVHTLTSLLKAAKFTLVDKVLEDIK